MTDSTSSTGSEQQPEVEGHPFKHGDPVAAPADVEGHAKRFFKRGEDAEAPTDETTIDADESRDGSEPEVEGHAKRFFR